MTKKFLTVWTIKNWKINLKINKNETDKKTDIDFEFVTPKKFNLADKIKIKTEDNEQDF